MINKQHCYVYIASCDENGGIYSYIFDEKGRFQFVEKTDLCRPMYIAIHIDKLYALLKSPFENSKESGLISYEMTVRGTLENKSSVQSTKGEEACHLLVEDDIYCVNYISGSVIKMPDKLVTHSGSSIHPTRQTSPHTHQVVFTPDNQYVCVVDLGLDKILIYDKNLNFVTSAEVPMGHGPRHIVFSPDGKYVFCANELRSTVTVFQYDDGKLTIVETYSTLPSDYQGVSAVAAIRISSDGKFLYISNRGHDSIACFRVDKNCLQLFDIVSCGGKFPRDFNITPNGKYLICTNEISDSVTVFKINYGRLIKTDVELELKSPLCVVFDDVK